jgi:hypothetical protein
MIAQNAIQLCAESLDSSTTLVVEEMGPEFDRDAMHHVKGMAEEQ